MRRNDPDSSMHDRISPPALALGAGGLLPFFALAALQWLTSDPRWLPMLAGYGAVILSFVGALHWGYAVRDAPLGPEAWLRYGWSVLPALLAWVCLMLPPAAGVLLLAGGLLGCLAIDERLARRIGSPAWLMRLRRVLTAGGAASLLLAGLA